MTNISHTSIGASTRLLTFDNTSLSIHIPLAGESRPSSCKVVWATSIEATTILYYRVNGESEWIPFIDDDELTKYHSILLTGLAINTLYDIWVRSEIDAEYVEAFIWALTTGTAIIISESNLYVIYGGSVLSNHKVDAAIYVGSILAAAAEGVYDTDDSNITITHTSDVSADGMTGGGQVAGTITTEYKEVI